MEDLRLYHNGVEIYLGYACLNQDIGGFKSYRLNALTRYNKGGNKGSPYA